MKNRDLFSVLCILCFLMSGVQLRNCFSACSTVIQYQRSYWCDSLLEYASSTVVTTRNKARKRKVSKPDQKERRKCAPPVAVQSLATTRQRSIFFGRDISNGQSHFLSELFLRLSGNIFLLLEQSFFLFFLSLNLLIHA